MLRILSLMLVATLSAGAAADADKDTTEAKPETKPDAKPETAQPDPAGRAPGLYAVITTHRGEIVLGLEFERAPMTVANFVGLAEGRLKNDARPVGQPFYDGLVFHRVLANFMIQGGCPEGTGRGGPGYRFPDEIHANLRHQGPGVLSMANSGPGTNGSQFFITHTATPWLDGRHTVFGHVLEGQSVVNAIVQGDAIETLRIVRVGEKAEAFTADQAHFDKLRKVSGAAAADDGKADLERVKTEFPKAEVADSGLRYIVTLKSEGAAPKRGTEVAVHYTGRLLDGKVFDSSRQRGEPIRFPVGVGRVIRGWDEGILMMRQGEQRTLIIPPELGYGSRGAGGVIPPNAWLVFDVELVSVD